MSDSYEGIIADVIEQPVRNRFTATRELEPVIVFEDGWRLIPNIGMRQTLVEFFGWETDAWVGRRIVVYRTKTDRVDRQTGEVRSRYEKRVRLPGTEGPA